MTAPAYTVAPDRLGGGVLLEMLDRGIRHFPVISARGELVGVVEDLDLIAVETRNSFYVRRQIAAASSVAELADAATQIHPMVVALHDTKLAATSIAAIYSVVLDALTRRVVDLAVAEIGEPDTAFAWLALGSQARREAVPSSDIDSAIVWYGDGDEGSIRPLLHDLGTRVVAGMRGLRAARRRPWRDGVRPALRALRGVLAARRALLAGGPDPGEGAALDLGARRQPAGVGHPRRDAGRRGVLPRPAPPGPAAPARALRALLPSAHRIPARPGRRAQRRAPRSARPQARRCRPDRRSRALGGDVGRRHAAPRRPSACASPARRGPCRRATRAPCSKPTSCSSGCASSTRSSS